MTTKHFHFLKQTIVLFFIFLSAYFGYSAPLSALAISDPYDLQYIPLSEKLNFDVAGSLATPIILNASTSFDIISHFIITLTYQSTTFVIGDFADQPALTNGLLIKYNNKNLLNNDTIKSNSDLNQYSDAFNRIYDDSSPHYIQLTSEYIFLDLHELIITSSANLQFYIQDDITAITSISEFSVFIKGYEYTTYAVGASATVQQVNQLQGQDPGQALQELFNELLPVAGYILVIGLLLLTLWKVLTL